MMPHRPALWFCIVLMLGVITGWYLTVPLVPIACAVVLLGLIVLLFHRSAFAPLVLYALIFLFGILKIGEDGKYHPENSISQKVNEEGTFIRLRGTVTDRAHLQGEFIRFTIDVRTMASIDTQVVVTGGVTVRVRRGETSATMVRRLEYGREVWLTGELRELSAPRNPTDFDYKRYQELNGIYAAMIVRDDKDIIVGERAGNWLLANVVSPSREWISATLDTLVGGEEAKLLKGLVIGERSEMDPEIKTAFINAGLMHILAVSGFNVALVAMILWSLFSFFRVNHLGLAALTALGIIFFVYLTGAQPSVVRAGIMAIVILGAKILERKSDLYNTVALAAIIILLIDARSLFDIGFQLSFMAVVSLAYFYPKFVLLLKYLPEVLSENVVVKYILLSVAVSMAATLGTLPIGAYYFHKVSLVGLAMNLIAVPISGVLLAIGFTIVVFALISSWLASVYAAAGTFLAKMFLVMTTWSGALPFAFVNLRIDLAMVVLLYIAFILLFELHHVRARKIFLFGFLIVANVYIFAGILFSREHRLRVTFLDVGQGDAIFVELPNRANILIDVGPRGVNSDAGAKVVFPFLQQKGIDHLNAVIVSHPHSDHLGGMPFLLRHLKVDRVIDAGSFGASSLVREYLHLVDSLHISREVLKAGSTVSVSDDVRMYVLHPSGTFIPKDSLERVNLNNQSLVIKLVFGTTKILFSGDAEDEAERQIELMFSDFLASDVIKIGHHGSTTSSSSVYINQIHPKYALISVGRNNKFQHPSPITLETLSGIHCEYTRTDENGAVVFESDGKNWRKVDWR